MTKFTASRWGDLFEQAAGIIDQANSKFPLIDNWTLGGGTALMLQIDHRESFDVDVFIEDPQVLPYLNPGTQGYALEIRPDAYVSDGSKTLKIVFANVGEIDFICASSLTDNPIAGARVCGRDILLETPAEIIARKVYYRGASMQPRDMFDIACVLKTHGSEYLIDALSPLKDECEKALEVALQMNPRFAATIMEKLLYRENFSDIPAKAQAMTIGLLETIRTGSTGARAGS